MTLRHFQIFTSVCDEGNMTAAAQSLFLSQSAVSQAVAELEAHYNVRLFERLSKKLYLTEAGEKLLGYARHMIRMNQDAESEMKKLNSGGTIRVGASVTIGAYVLPKLVADYQNQNPAVNVIVTEDNTAQVEGLILRDQADLGLVEGETLSSDLFKLPFLEDELVLICSPEHRFAKMAQVEPQELEKENFIVREKGSGTRRTFENVMEENGLSWQVTWTCNNSDTIKMAVVEKLGVSVISKRAVENEIRSGLLVTVPIRAVCFLRKFRIIHHKNKYLTQPMRQFMESCCMLEYHF